MVETVSRSVAAGHINRAKKKVLCGIILSLLMAFCIIIFVLRYTHIWSSIFTDHDFVNDKLVIMKDEYIIVIFFDSI